MRLSQHYTLEDFSQSDLADRAGIDNTPGKEIIPRLAVVAQALENLSAGLGLPVVLTSGFRCTLLNGLIPGSSPTSAHCEGWAADIKAPPIPPLELAQHILHSTLKFDQLILEYSWVHVSLAPALRRMVLTKKIGSPYKEGLVA